MVESAGGNSIRYSGGIKKFEVLQTKIKVNHHFCFFQINFCHLMSYYLCNHDTFRAIMILSNRYYHLLKQCIVCQKKKKAMHLFVNYFVRSQFKLPQVG